MNKHDKNSQEESLLSLFLSESNSIDADIKKANEVIVREGLDPKKLQREGLAFIKELQHRAKAEAIKAPQLDLDYLLKRLVDAGLSKSFVQKRILLSFSFSENKKIEIPVSALSSFVASIFGLKEQDILGTGALAFVDSPAGWARFKAPVNANISQIRAYSHYAYYLANLVVKNRKPTKVEYLPGDINELKENYFNKYKSIDLASLINYVWDLGICVLPLNDPGVFHGACWNIGGTRVIVVKQNNTKSHARWIFDLLHELYHALVHLEDSGSYVIETEELNPFIDNDSVEEKEANAFAHQFLFGDQTQQILNKCIEQTGGKMERLKNVVQKISREENVREDVLANYLAFRLSLEGQNWWGSAAALQILEPDPFSIASQILLKNIFVNELKQMDQILMMAAVLNN